MRTSWHFKMSIAISFASIFVLSLTLLMANRSVLHASGLTLSPNISVFPLSGSPLSVTKVSGHHFGVSEVVNLSLDTTPLGTASTDSTGAFTASVTIPKAALPGTHTINAVGQTSGLAAQTNFLVATPWDNFGFDDQNTRSNNLENLLSASNVSTLTQDWVGTTGGSV